MIATAKYRRTKSGLQVHPPKYFSRVHRNLVAPTLLSVQVTSQENPYGKSAGASGPVVGQMHEAEIF
jgi:hypothetical protein